MNRIVAPLKHMTRGAAVRDLHDALLLLFDRGYILGDDDGQREDLVTRIGEERRKEYYFDATYAAVQALQERVGLEPTGQVDTLTSEALNRLLESWSMIDTSHTPRSYIVSGKASRDDGVPVQGAQIHAAHVSNEREIRLGNDSTDAAGRYTIRYEALPGTNSVNLKVSALDEAGRTVASSQIIANANVVEIIDLVVPVALPTSDRIRIEGSIYYEYGLPADKLKLRLYRREFGGQIVFVQETETVGSGRYSFSYDAGASGLEVRAVTAEGTEVSLSKPLYDLTAESRAHLNLLAPASLQPLAGEYRRLTDALKPHVLRIPLKDAREDARKRDLSILSHATGWDARLIALACVSERLAHDPAVGLPSEAIYGLLRAGLPSDKLLLAQVEPEVVELVIKKARDSGIVEIDDASIANLKTNFITFSENTLLTIPLPGSRSTYADLLRSSGLPKKYWTKFTKDYLTHQGDIAQFWQKARDQLGAKQVSRLRLQGKFAFLAGNSTLMTARILQKGLKDPSELAAQGFHNPTLWKDELAELLQEKKIPQEGIVSDLAVHKLKQLEALIPVRYASEKIEERKDAFAKDMARKVRLSYPTHVLAHLMETDQHFKVSVSHDATVTLLNDATAQGFRLGKTPVSMFMKSHPDLGDGLSNAAERITATENLMVLQRIYQITPSNEAMPVLMELGVTSAFDVLAYTENQFITFFDSAYMKVWGTPAPTGVPQLISRKAKQVSSVTYNLFAAAKTLDSEPTVRLISGTPNQHAAAKSTLKGALKGYPTMEALFGSLEYCECEHCRSVLSPAAYFVDLLQFVDVEPTVWGNFVNEWNEIRGAEYKADWITKPDGTTRNSQERKPYDALIERRPDLPHIALNCENTNTALPYIDIVNEILEYYVANGKLEQEAVHNTGTATTAELLAEPQYVIREAYDVLHLARYPLNLPFDLWLETVRKFCDYFEMPLHNLLEVMRHDEDCSATIMNSTNVDGATVDIANADATKLTKGTICTFLVWSTNAPSGEWKSVSKVGKADSGGSGLTKITFKGSWGSAPRAGDRLISRPLEYRAAIFMESLGLSPMEVEIFTDPNPMKNWHTLYGFASEKDATTEATDSTTGERLDLNSAKVLAHRLGVTYKELSDIVQTGFVNPELVKLTLLYKLDISVRDAKFYKDAESFYAANKDLLGANRSELSQTEKQRFDDLSKLHPTWKVTGWQALYDVKALEQRLTNLAELFGFPLNVVELRNVIKGMPFESVLVLAAPDTGCNFDQTILQYADGEKAEAIAFLRINLFVRLWRTLGWSIDETDHALTTFIPQSTPFDRVRSNLAKKPLKTALIYLSHFKMLSERLKVGKESRHRLLTFWSDVANTGRKPLYAQLFLTKSILQSDAVFDDPLGNYLSVFSVGQKDVHAVDQLDKEIHHAYPNVSVDYNDDTGEQRLSYKGSLNDIEKERIRSTFPESILLASLLDQVQAASRIEPHMLTVQGALGLTADDVYRILKDEGQAIETAELSIPNLSLLYRHRLLAKALKISVYELIALKHISGLNPFRALQPDPLITLDQDNLLFQTLEFVNVAEEIKESGFKIEDLEFLLLHRFDESGKYREDREDTFALIKSLSEGVHAIRIEHAVPDDPNEISEEVLRQKLGMALAPDVVERLLGMVNGTAEFTVSKQDVKSHGILPATLEGYAGIQKVKHNRKTSIQRLTYRGVLFDTEKSLIQLKFNPTLTQSQRNTLTDILSGVQKAAIEAVHTGFIGTVTEVEPPSALFPNLFKGEAAIRTSSYDSASKVQTLEYQGVLSDLEKSALKQRLGGSLTAAQASVFELLLDDVQSQIRTSVVTLFTAEVKSVTSGGELPPDIMAEEARIVEARYSSNEQKLTIRGVVSDEGKRELHKKFGTKLTETQQQVYSELLDALEASAGEFFEKQLKNQTLSQGSEAGFLGDEDFPELFEPPQPLEKLNALDSPKVAKLKQEWNQAVGKKVIARRKRIAEAFLPRLQERLIHQFIVQTTAAYAKVDPMLIDSLITDKRLLAAPDALLNYLTEAGKRGLDVTFTYVEANKAPLSVVLPEADTNAKNNTNKLLEPSGIESGRFDAYIEVPTTGTYRFYIELSKGETQAALRFPHLSAPEFLAGQALPDQLVVLGDQPDEYIELKAGVLYRLSLELNHLKAGSARLLIQGERLPKGPLSQLKLYPAASIEVAKRALTLLSKALQLVQILGLSLREIQYLLSTDRGLDGMRLSDLPTAVPPDTVEDRAITAQRFKRLRRLADYARLKRDLAEGTDDLIAVFEVASASGQEWLAKIAKLTRREPELVQATIEALARTQVEQTFEGEKSLRRLWEVLQAIERFGVMPETLSSFREIISNTITGTRRFELARKIKESIKARFDAETWQRVAQPIFDRLRARQRDALVSQSVQQLSRRPETANINTQEKLYEYLLIDPGMEPAVQTSRIRLAISSLQLFVQRSLLNLEPNVHPTAINADHWEWMKRYRVWEANRKIFLYPENWLEPEFRDDKTHLFTELEGALLQGDVSSDLVEDAFFNYLKKLDELARLDICAMHLEDNNEPALRVLHVFGRTYSQPYKYFYRQYVNHIWTPWEPVSIEIEGKHLAPVVWRDRLHLFWVTFTFQADTNPTSTDIADETALQNLKLSDIKKELKPEFAVKRVDVNLHWSEYVNGVWSTRASGDYSTPLISKTVPVSFKSEDIFVHVSKEYDSFDGSDLGVSIHLTGDIYYHVTLFNSTLSVAGRNSPPMLGKYSSPPINLFSADSPKVNSYEGRDNLQVKFNELISTRPNESILTWLNILQDTGEGKFTLLPCNNNIRLGVSVDAYQGADQPDAVRAAIESGLDEIATLMKPIFYQDSQHTFFVETDITEQTLEEWEEWLTRTQLTAPSWSAPDSWKVVPQIPLKGRIVPPFPPLEDSWPSLTFEAVGRGYPIEEQDWFIDIGSMFEFGGVLIGPTGWSGLEIRVHSPTPNIKHDMTPGLRFGLIRGSNIVLTDPEAFTRSGLREMAVGLNVVDGKGLNPALQQNLAERLSVSSLGVPRFGRMKQ